MVRPVTATCDLDRAVIAGLTPFDPVPSLGHECVAETVELGPDVPGLAVVPWHVSCGSCENRRDGAPSRCAAVPRHAMFGLPLGGDWGGLFADLVRVPWAAANLVRVPAGVDPGAVASASDNLVDAYRSVLLGQRRLPGAPVLVFGGTSIGLWACAFAGALGGERVVYVDGDKRRRRIAAGYGADAASTVEELDRPEYPLTVDAAGHPKGLSSALRATAPGGYCHSVGIYFADTRVPTGPMYLNAVTLTTGPPDVTPHLADVLALVSAGTVDPMPVFSDRCTFDALPEVLRDVPEKPLVTRSPS
ncbi:zinc-binding dehydrogenase [Amycolatopsis sacchari]|uniref:zinc-binding dehydrogenase n=1 Tax=Amycolatopsis sacchari TaxID=115433 RepID=UPI003D7206D3